MAHFPQTVRGAVAVALHQSAGVLVFIGRTHGVVLGGVALFSLAMGMSVPLLLVGASAGSLLPRAGAWMEAVKRFFGILLLAVALWMVAPVLPVAVVMLLLGAALLFAAGTMGLLDAGAAAPRRSVRALALVVAVLGVFELAGALAGARDPVQPLAGLGNAALREPAPTSTLAFRRVRDASELDRALLAASGPVLLDVYADWCTSCKEMERLTFEDPAVRPRLARAERLRLDVTANSADDRQLLKRLGLFGPPGMLFFAPGGREHEAARVIGYVPAAEFGAALTTAGL